MRAEVEVRRDEQGRLVGEIHFGATDRQSFIGVVELVGLIERGLAGEASGAGPPGQPERGS